MTDPKVSSFLSALKEPHFLVAAAILALAALGWGYVEKIVGIVLYREPVPWPAGVIIDGGFRLQSLPDQFGPYVLAGDGTLNKGKEGEPDGKPDGDIVLPRDMLELLHVGSGDDKSRLENRCSNWYVSRIYRDTRPNASTEFWRLEITYYTGGLDKVPHIPEVCLLASGATLRGSSQASFQAPAARTPWDKPIPFNRTDYEIPGETRFSTRRYVQYYVFSLNGEPEASWEKVRLNLSLSMDRYCYFAKIQFAPMRPVAEGEDTDPAAADFVKFFLPGALDALPMRESIQALNAAGDK